MEYNFNEMIERLKTIKKSKKITNKELSEMSGVPFGTLNKILGTETQETNISTVIKLSSALGVNAEELIFGINREDDRAPLNSHEWKVIDAYRAQPEMQTAVDRLLGIEVSEDEAKKTG